MATRVLDRLIVQYGTKADLSGLRRLEQGVKRTRDRLNAFSAKAALVGTAVSGGLVGMGKAFADLEAKWAEVSAKTGFTVKQLKNDYKDAAREISEVTGVSQLKILDTLQKSISAGLVGEAAIRGTEVSAKIQAARIGDAEEAISAATTVTTGFGIPALEALDQIARAAQVGEGEAEHFATALKAVVATAKPLGVTFDQLAGSLSAASTIAESVIIGRTQLNSFLRSIGSPKEGQMKNLEEITGGQVKFEHIMATMRESGIAAAVGMLQTITKGDPRLISKILPRSEAQAFFNVANPDQINRLATEIKNSAGTVEAAFIEGEGTILRVLGQIGETLKNVLRDMGETLLPTFRLILRGLRGVADFFRDMSTPVKSFLAHALLIGPALLAAALAAKIFAFALGGVTPIVAAVGWAHRRMTAGVLINMATIKAALIAGWTSTMTAIVATTQAASALIGRALLMGLMPILAITAPVWLGLAAIAAIAGLIYLAWTPIKTWFEGLWVGWQANLDDLGDAFDRLIDALGPVGQFIMWIGGLIGDVFSWAGEKIAALFAWFDSDQTESGYETGSSIAEGMIEAIDAITDLINWIAGLPSAFWTAHTELTKFFADFNQWVVDLFTIDLAESGKRMIKTFVEGFESVKKWMEQKWEDVVGGIRDLLPFSNARVGPLSNLRESGRSLWVTFMKGARMSAPMIQQINSSLSELMTMMPMSDARRGPLRNLTASGRAMIETIADGMRQARPLSESLNLPTLDTLINPFRVGPVLAPAGIGGGTSIEMSFSDGAITINVPSGDAAQIAASLRDELQQHMRAGVEQLDSRVLA